ncbi:hypothetical protein R6Q59_023720 [Mikania micrantha]
MASQGIKGPPYRFIHGNTKEIAAMKDQANTRTFTDISHDIYPRIQPHFFTWFQLYGWSWCDPSAIYIYIDEFFGKKVYGWSANATNGFKRSTYDPPLVPADPSLSLADSNITKRGWMGFKRSH